MMGEHKRSYLVIGLGRFGASLAKTLFDLGHEVLVIDKDEETIDHFSKHATHAVIGDATDEDVLKSLGVRNFDIAVVALGGDLQASIMITVLLKEMGVKYILAKAQSELHAKILVKVGADRAILPESEMGIRVAHSLAKTNILDFIELSADYSIIELSVPQRWIGKILKDLDVRVKYGVNILAIRGEKDFNISPVADDVMRINDVLVIIGENKDLNKIKM